MRKGIVVTALLIALIGLALRFALAPGMPGSDREQRELSTADRVYQATLMEQLVLAQPGDVIDVPAGVFRFDRSLTLNVDDVTLRGQGMNETVLSFSGQVAGAGSMAKSGLSVPVWFHLELRVYEKET